MEAPRRLILLLALLALGSPGCQRRAASEDRQAAPAEPSLLGGERGIDHVGIAVKDLRAARQTFLSRLGFDRPIAGHLPNGIDNVNFYFEDATYLELLTFYDRQKVPWLAWFIDRHSEGANFVVLSTRSVLGTAAFLRQRGLSTSAPVAGSIEIQGGLPGGTWHTLFFERSPLPGSPLYFIEYPPRERADFLAKLEDPDIRRRSFPHRNTALGIKAVWMAVPDLDAARRAYLSIGLAEGAAFESAPLHASVKAIAAGRGHIFLMSPRGASGPVKDFLDRRGPGVLGMSIEVRSLDSARQVVSQGTRAPPPPHEGPLGPGLLIAPAHAHGAWIELFARRHPG